MRSPPCQHPETHTLGDHSLRKSWQPEKGKAKENSPKGEPALMSSMKRTDRCHEPTPIPMNPKCLTAVLTRLALRDTNYSIVLPKEAYDPQGYVNPSSNNDPQGITMQHQCTEIDPLLRSLLLQGKQLCIRQGTDEQMRSVENAPSVDTAAAQLAANALAKAAQEAEAAAEAAARARGPIMASYYMPKELGDTVEVLNKKTTRRLASHTADARKPWITLYSKLDAVARQVVNEPERAIAIHHLALTALCGHHTAALGTVAPSRSANPFPTEIYYRNLTPPADQAQLNEKLEEVIKSTWQKGDLDLTYVPLQQYPRGDPAEVTAGQKYAAPETGMPGDTLMLKFTCQDPHRMGRLVAALADPEWVLSQQPEYVISNSRLLLHRPARWIPTFPPGAPDEQADILLRMLLKPLCDDPMLTHNPYDNTVNSRRSKDIIRAAIQEFSCRRVIQLLGPDSGWEIVHSRALTRTAAAPPLTQEIVQKLQQALLDNDFYVTQFTDLHLKRNDRYLGDRYEAKGEPKALFSSHMFPLAGPFHIHVPDRFHLTYTPITQPGDQSTPPWNWYQLQLKLGRQTLQRMWMTGSSTQYSTPCSS